MWSVFFSVAQCGLKYRRLFFFELFPFIDLSSSLLFLVIWPFWTVGSVSIWVYEDFCGTCYLPSQADDFTVLWESSMPVTLLSFVIGLPEVYDSLESRIEDLVSSTCTFWLLFLMSFSWNRGVLAWFNFFADYLFVLRNFFFSYLLGFLTV